MSHDNIESHIKVYKNVFFALLVGTVLTVAVSYIHFDLFWVGLLVGLLIEGAKAYLVAANFMHLNNESSTIYWSLLLTVLFLIVLFAIPILWHNDIARSETTVLFDDPGKKVYSEKGHH